MVRFSRREVWDIGKACVVISLAFAIVYSPNLSSFSIFSDNLPKFSIYNFLIFFLISLFTAGIGFVFHELGHKIVAQKYGARAEFRAFDKMLLLAFVMSFFGFLFAAPGAVFIHGRLSRKENGVVSLAGPFVNIVLAMFFVLLSLLYGSNLFFEFGSGINSWLALFNLIPFMPLDGAKVLGWNKAVYFAFLVFSLLLVFAGF